MAYYYSNQRRRFLKYAGAGALGLSGLPGMLRAMTKPSPNRASSNFQPDVEMELVARQVSFPILPGTLTNVQKYYGKVLKGPTGCVLDLPGSYLGPVLRFTKGQKVRIHFRNELREPTITHWHGLHVPALMDGHPMYQLDNGETFVYEFEVDNRAATCAYHSHAHELTGSQVYQGLVGLITVSDEEEQKLVKLGLPTGDYDIPLAIQDKAFDGGNQLVYVQHMMERMTGFHGDRILINGKPNVELSVDSRVYRFRIGNLSNARIYKLAWGDGTPLTVIGTDGGLLERPITKPYVMLAPGERIDVWADFSGREVGAEIVLKSLPFSGVLPPMFAQMMEMMGGKGMGGMDHGMMGGGGGRGMGMGMMGSKGMGGMDHGMMMQMPMMKLPVGSEYPILKVKVTRKVSDSPTLPTQLSSFKRYEIKDTANPNKSIPIGISEGPMSMLMNGRPYKMDDVQEFEKIKVNSLQFIEIFHAHGSEGGSGGGSAQHGAAGQAPAASGEHGAAGGGGMGMGGQGMGGMGHSMMMGGGGQGMGGMGHGMMGGGMQGQGSEGQGGGQQGHAMSGGGGGMGGMGGGMGGMGGGMGMMFSMAHPIHLHGQQFQIIRRSIDMAEGEHYDTVKNGFINEGFKDVALVMPGERVAVIKPFDTFQGLFMYHCHNLEHEDMGMMREFLVV